MLSSYSRGPRHPHPLPVTRAPLAYFRADLHRGADITVYLDGAPVPLAIEASTVEGFVVAYVAAGEGIQRDSLDRPVLLKARGVVEIRQA